MSTAPRIAVTGPHGFVAWHLRCAVRERWGCDVVGIGRAEFSDPALMDAALARVDVIIHLAGVNRAANVLEVERMNPWLAERVVSSLSRIGRSVPIVYGNSIHAQGDTAFGESKRRAAEILRSWSTASGSPLMDVHLPNLFGEHAKPNYNSVVATFSHALAQGAAPRVVDDKELPLMHVSEAVDALLDFSVARDSTTVALKAPKVFVSELAEILSTIAGQYKTGVLPDLSDPFIRRLFNTYRSAVFPQQFPIHPNPARDPRGHLVEAVRGRGGEVQVFYSTTNPGFTRGQHWHRHKVERFMVISGTGIIRLRRLFTDEIVGFVVSGHRPAVVDMPTLWAHSITNQGDEPLVTLFYADECFDPAKPDTIPEEV